MPHRDDTEQRLTALEIKASFGEDLVDRLNDIIVRQQAQIDRLRRDLDELLRRAPEAPAEGLRSLRDELPPHY
jgi:SlyX protein